MSENRRVRQRITPYGPPTTPEIEPEIILITGTTSRPNHTAAVQAAGTLLQLVCYFNIFSYNII